MEILLSHGQVICVRAFDGTPYLPDHLGLIHACSSSCVQLEVSSTNKCRETDVAHYNGSDPLGCTARTLSGSRKTRGVGLFIHIRGETGIKLWITSANVSARPAITRRDQCRSSSIFCSLTDYDDKVNHRVTSKGGDSRKRMLTISAQTWHLVLH